MKYKWLNKEAKNTKVVIFFNGWGMDENVVSHLNCENYDVLMFYDYNTLDTDFDFDMLEMYSEKNLIAWSMGVMVGGMRKWSPNSLKRAVAINGTLKPIDEKYGIHPKIYDLTIKGFNEKGRKRFISSMFEQNVEISCNREIENQLSELIALKNYKAIENFRYDKVIISNNDKIIPTKSQIAFWGIEPNLKGGHCPFFQFEKWSDLL